MGVLGGDGGWQSVGREQQGVPSLPYVPTQVDGPAEHEPGPEEPSGTQQSAEQPGGGSQGAYVQLGKIDESKANRKLRPYALPVEP